MPVADRYMLRYSTSLITRKMNLKATIRYYLFILSGMMMIKNIEENKCWRGDGEKETHSAGRNVNQHS